VATGLISVINEGFPVSVIRSDSENFFRSVKSQINSQGVRLQFAAPGAHEKRVEIQIKYIRSRFEVVKASLGYTLPTYLYPYLLCDIASALNMIPNANSPSLCPFTMVTGKKLSMKCHLRFQFGEVVVVNNTPSRSHATSPSVPSSRSPDDVIGKDRDVRLFRSGSFFDAFVLQSR
jgi:hypothetical protein